MKPEEIYKPVLKVESTSIFGKLNYEIGFDDEDIKALGILSAFVADNDVQEITIVSTNLGVVKTFRKEYLHTHHTS